MLASAEAASGFAPGDHASTFGGNYLAAAVANKVIDIMTAEDFFPQVKQNGAFLMKGLQAIKDPRIVKVRGSGLILGMEFDQEIKTLVDICLEKGLLLVGAGPQVLRFVPPLTVNQTEINQALNILKESLKDWR